MTSAPDCILMTYLNVQPLFVSEQFKLLYTTDPQSKTNIQPLLKTAAAMSKNEKALGRG